MPNWDLLAAIGTPGPVGNDGRDGGGLKNAVMNGDFQVWQRGTSFSSPADQVYAADRWKHVLSASSPGTYTISRQTFTPGQTDVLDGEYFLRLDRTVAGTITFQGLTHGIENVRTFDNRTVTLSFYAKAASAVDINPKVSQVFGSGGSSSVDHDCGNVTLSTSWQRFTFTFSMPSISGKTIGTNNCVQVAFFMPTSGTFTVDIANVQLEASSVVSAFERIPFGELLRRCQRYYCKTFDYATAPASNTGQTGCISSVFCSQNAAAGKMMVNWRYPVEMRIVPSITTYNPSAAGSAFRSDSGSDIAATVSNNGCGGTEITASPSAGANQWFYLRIHAVAFADF